MLRLSNWADYGIVVMGAVARQGGRASAARIAAATGLPSPTVAKLMGQLARAGLLVSHRGVAGGFALAQPAGQIGLHQVIEALDGPIALTHCGHDADACQLSGHCVVRPHWEPVNRAVRSALAAVTLDQLALAADPGQPGAAGQRARAMEVAR